MKSDVPKPPQTNAMDDTRNDSQDSPAYQAPETDDEDAEMGSAEVRETVSYECTECQMNANDIFHVMMHLEEDHGVPEDEEILRSKVKVIKIKQ